MDGEPVNVSILLIMADPGYAYVIFIGSETGWKTWGEEQKAISASIHGLSEF